MASLGEQLVSKGIASTPDPLLPQKEEYFILATESGLLSILNEFSAALPGSLCESMPVFLQSNEDQQNIDLMVYRFKWDINKGVSSAGFSELTEWETAKYIDITLQPHGVIQIHYADQKFKPITHEPYTVNKMDVISRDEWRQDTITFSILNALQHPFDFHRETSFMSQG